MKHSFEDRPVPKCNLGTRKRRSNESWKVAAKNILAGLVAFGASKTLQQGLKVGSDAGNLKLTKLKDAGKRLWMPSWFPDTDGSRILGNDLEDNLGNSLLLLEGRKQLRTVQQIAVCISPLTSCSDVVVSLLVGRANWKTPITGRKRSQAVAASKRLHVGNDDSSK